jgi:predicted solute-binding protein
LAYEGDLKNLTKVALDPASHTSNALLRIVLEGFHGITPEYVQLTETEKNFTPALMIGDRAIETRNRTTNPSLRFLDLGGEWYRHTGLPFVFAIWELKNEFTDKSSLSAAIREAKSKGIAAIPKIAALEEDPEFAKGYLRHHIQYDLGEEEKRGLHAFGEYLQRLHIVDEIVQKIVYL